MNHWRWTPQTRLAYTTGRIAARFGVPLDVAHAIATAVLYRCYLVTRDPKTVAATGPAGLEVLDINDTWD
jgi:phosphoenolpyruvate synthase/pyruvate phosphate dikinase